MDQLIKLGELFAGYFSPAKRRRTIGGSVATPSREPLSTEIPATDPVRRNRTTATKRHSAGPSTKQFPSGSRKRARDFDDVDCILDSNHVKASVESGYTASLGSFSDNSSFSASSLLDPDDSASQIVPNNADISAITDYDEEEGEPQLTAEEKIGLWREKERKLEPAKALLNDTIAQGIWTEDEKFLLQRLAMRSYEPLFPAEWQLDFPTFPVGLFTLDFSKTFINFNCTSSHKAVRAFQALIDLAGRVRDKKLVRLPVERVMELEIKRYARWTEEDGGYINLRFIPNTVIVTKRPAQTFQESSHDLISQMTFLAERYRAMLALPTPKIGKLGEIELYSKQPPIIYGITIVASKVFLWTMDSAKIGAKPKFIQHFEFAEEGMDVWNAIAVAIFLVMARNYIISIKDELEPDFDESDDPDL
ncbi:hypothetical protein BP6252_08646 [Coleophoma cylindrospora]|uniref:Uncharacterized protein n=1 Tax=Coleophoma cylindrospora TaxID=1849047 RepID=A0A3D8R6L7_9HELO|nr:hypothetical protein BP6252_08646 [Coleophoma cylindrospora]